MKQTKQAECLFLSEFISDLIDLLDFDADGSIRMIHKLNKVLILEILRRE